MSGKKMTVTQLEGQLQEYPQEKLIDLICRMYKTCPEAALFISSEFGDTAYTGELLEKTKAKIRREFGGSGRLSLTTAKSVITSFKKVCSDDTMVLDLQLDYVECGIMFTNRYGDINASFYNSMCRMYWTVVETLNKLDREDMFEKFHDRLQAAVDDTSGIGWGFHDDLYDSYYQLKWVKRPPCPHPPRAGQKN